jgi:integrase
MARELNAYLKAAKITKRIRFHDLRHTAATMMLQAGAPVQHVSKILGHSSIAITVDTYGHLVTDDLRAAVALVAFDVPSVGLPADIGSDMVNK